MAVFTVSEFVPAHSSTDVEKAQFANELVRFAQEGFQRKQFSKRLYHRLSNCFGHIAHYDIDGFYAMWFADDVRRLAWLQHIIKGRLGGIGDPRYTYSDVERALKSYFKESDLADVYAEKVRSASELAERAEYARLQTKYGGI